MTETPRRPMTAALRTADLSPEELAFIRAGTPQPKLVEITPQTKPPPTAATEDTADSLDTRPERTQKPESLEKARALKPRATREREPESTPLAHRINLSIRVPTEIPEGLLRASTDRKLKRIKPSSQQEIAAEAISEWLSRHGYL